MIDAVDASTQRLTPEERSVWMLNGYSTQQAERWVAGGVTSPALAGQWQNSDLGFDEALAWVAAGVERPRDVTAWKLLGCTPKTAPSGFETAYHYAFTLAAHVPATTQWGALWQVAPAPVAGIGHRQGQEPAAVAALSDAIVPSLEDVPATPAGHSYLVVSLRLGEAWLGERVKAFEEFAETLDGLAWADVALCLRAGMAPAEAAAHVRSGQDLGPVEVMAALLAAAGPE